MAGRDGDVVLDAEQSFHLDPKTSGAGAGSVANMGVLVVGAVLEEGVGNLQVVHGSHPYEPLTIGAGSNWLTLRLILANASTAAVFTDCCIEVPLAHSEPKAIFRALMKYVGACVNLKSSCKTAMHVIPHHW